MSNKLYHCASRVVASPMEEEEVSPLECTEDIPQVASSEGAHSSREPSEYFNPKIGVEVPLQVIGGGVKEDEVEVTDRDAEGSLALSQVEEEQAPQCACTQHPPQLTEDVVMRLADVSPALVPVEEEAPPLYLVSRQRCTRHSGPILLRFRKPYLHPTHFLGQDLRISTACHLHSEFLRQRYTRGLAERDTSAGYWAEDDRGPDDSDVGAVDKWDLYGPSRAGIGYDVQSHVQPQ